MHPQSSIHGSNKWGDFQLEAINKITNLAIFSLPILRQLELHSIATYIFSSSNITDSDKDLMRCFLT